MSSLPVPVSPRINTYESSPRDQSHLIQDFRKRTTVAYDLAEIVRCLDLLLKVLVLEAELAKRFFSAPALVDIAKDQSVEPSTAHAGL